MQREETISPDERARGRQRAAAGEAGRGGGEHRLARPQEAGAEGVV